MDGEEITDVTLEYATDFVWQLLEYGNEYSFLPYYNSQWTTILKNNITILKMGRSNENKYYLILLNFNTT